MSLVRFASRNHPQQTPKDEVDDRGTDPEFFAKMNERFGRFDLDVAAAPHNAKCERYYTRMDDGLAQPWDANRVWCNPPYSNIRPWIEKASAEWAVRRQLIVMLLPANRTEQKWWQELVEPVRDSIWRAALHVEFLPGRLRFVMPGETTIPPNSRPPFGCCLLIWGAA